MKQTPALIAHREWGGKLRIAPVSPVDTREALSLAYTPGVADPCLAIAEDPELAYVYTGKHNAVAVVTDGTAVLGLGDIGPAAALPVMEGKCALFRAYGGVDAYPICLDTKDADAIVDIVAAMAPGFGGINLEDISAPRCFDIEARLIERLGIPVFHDDQHGTAIVAMAALINACRVVGKPLESLKIAVSGFGAAGCACVAMLLEAGATDIVACGRKGVMQVDTATDDHRRSLLSRMNPRKVTGSLADAMVGADVFLGVSGPGIVSQEMVAAMAPGAILLAMANPVPEILPDLAMAAGAAVVGTGRSDFPNQINNVLAFPGVFRGALDARATRITSDMKWAAARALAELVENPAADCILPSPFDERVCPAVAGAVAKAAGGGQ